MTKRLTSNDPTLCPQTTPTQRSNLALDRLITDQETYWRRGVRVAIEELVQTEGTHVCHDEAVLELICNEIVLREQLAEQPHLEEYQVRFPKLADALRIQFEVARFLDGNFPAVSDTESTGDETARRGNGGRGALQIGRYHVVRELGRGAIGIVYEAWDPILKRTVAVKRLRGGADADEDLIERVILEAEAVAKVEHPHIIAIYDVVHEQCQTFLAMEYCRGGNLAERLKNGPIEPRQSAEMVLKIAHAVAKAHQCRIIHRDLKPANVLLESETGYAPKITDFGLAKRMDDQHGATATGNILGTPAYMAPEQAFGESKYVGPAADIYSIGAILYECLTGRPPFRGVTVTETLDHVRKSTPVPVRILQPQITQDLETICHKCLEKEPVSRYASAVDLIDDLERFLSGRPIRARRVSAMGHLWRWSRRNRALAALVSTVSILITVIAVGSTIAAIRLKRESNAARSAQRRLASSDEARRQELVRVYISDAVSATERNGVDKRRVGTEAIHRALNTVSWDELTPLRKSELVDSAIPLLTLLEARIVQRSALNMHQDRSLYPIVDVDPELKYSAGPTRGNDCTVVERIADQSDTYEVDHKGQQHKQPSVRKFSPHGRWGSELQFAGTLRLLIWDHASHQLVFDQLDGSSQYAFHPDERHVLWPVNNTLRMYEIETGKLVSESPARFRFPKVAFNHDGSLIAIAMEGQPAEIIDATTWETKAAFPALFSASSTEWHPTQNLVYFGSGNGTIHACQNDSDSMWRTYIHSRAHTEAVTRLVVSPNGKMIASASDRNTIIVTSVDDQHSYTQLSGCPLRFSADGRRLAVARWNELEILEFRQSKVLHQIPIVSPYRAATTSDPQKTSAAEFSSDGKWLGVSGLHGVQLYDAHRLNRVADLGLDHCGPVAFHPGGEGLITYGKFSQAWYWPFGGPENNRLGPPTLLKSSGLSWTGMLSPQHAGRHAAWSGSGQTFVVGEYRQGKILVGDRSNGKLRELASMHAPTQVAISPNGEWVAAADQVARHWAVWNTVDGSLQLESNSPAFVAFEPDGTRLAIRQPLKVDIYRVSDWQITLEIKLDSRSHLVPGAVQFQPHGTLLAVADAEHGVILYDSRNGDRIATLTDDTGRSANWLSFSPDGIRLAVTYDDRIMIWNLAELGVELGKLGLQVDLLSSLVGDLPMITSDDIPPLKVDRGRLIEPSRWYTRESMLARSEAAKVQWPDAIFDMTKALSQARQDDQSALPQLLTERGNYFRRNLSFAAALDDYRQALELDPNERTAAVGLARLYLLGPPDIQAAAHSLPLAANMLIDPETKSVGQLLLAIARVRLASATTEDRELLESIRTGVTGSFDVDWRIAAGFLLAIDQRGEMDIEGYGATVKATVELYEQRRHELTSDIQQELDRLRAEITTE